MNKILLVLQREYLSRVRKKSFLIMTLVGPLLMGGLFVAIALMDKVDNEPKRIAVLDNTGMFTGKFTSHGRVSFVSVNQPLEKLRAVADDSGYFGILYIPVTENVSALEKAIVLYSESQPGIEVVSRIESTVEAVINENKYKAAGIDPLVLKTIKSDVSIRTYDMEDKETSTPLASGLGFVGGLLIYMFIFVYGTMVMRGVMEEKTNRIVEVIISSVRPFELMLGKIIGVALVGLTQFLLWVVLSTVVFTVVGRSFMEPPAAMSGLQTMAANEQVATSAVGHTAAMDKVMTIMDEVNFPAIIAMFIFYFLGGYLLYSALFAAIGAAVDADTDVQQFMVPITMPLILSYIAAVNVLNNPQGELAFWFSVIPFTSPIVMMVRLPFGVPWTHVAVSMVLLIAGFVFTTWMAGKIYRTGILLYGKKVTYRELWRWIRYRNA